jgi:hypothetical protein
MKKYFNGSVYRDGHGVGHVLISHNNIAYETSVRLKCPCTNNQTEYKVLVCSRKFSRYGC